MSVLWLVGPGGARQGGGHRLGTGLGPGGSMGCRPAALVLLYCCLREMEVVPKKWQILLGVLKSHKF